MNTFADLRRSDMRLVMLRCIEEGGFSLNESILEQALRLYGHCVSRDQVRTEIRWLEEQGLVTVEEVAGSILVASITGRGVDVAAGRAHVDGVKRPRPRG